MSGGDVQYALSSGHTCTLRPRPLPLLRTYHVLFFPRHQGRPSAQEEREMFYLAQRTASELGTRFHGDPGCFAILFSGRRTRRRPWPHFHIIAARNVAGKRRALVLLHFRSLLVRLDKVSRRLGFQHA